MRIVIETFVVPPFGENTYLLGDSDAGVGIVIDPGGRADEIVATAARHGLRIEKIMNTHGHIDHVAGVAALQALTKAPFHLHADAEPPLAELPLQARRFGLPDVVAPQVDHYIEPGGTVSVGELELAIRYTPGHAPGHVTFVTPDVEWEGSQRVIALCGDAIFRGSIGRVDLPGGDMATLRQSIEREIMTLADDTLLLPGHGPATTVGHERATNPFVQAWLRGERTAF